uniref:Uncharacterized protein n=1 Tax=Romanomermis culicivorax TaxID=13658 RepID=A0A915JTU9_ROMCU
MQRFRFNHQGILNITELSRGDIESPTQRNRAIPAILQTRNRNMTKIQGGAVALPSPKYGLAAMYN